MSWGSRVKNKDFVYIASPKGCWGGVLKIGYTSRRPQVRAKELKSMVDYRNYGNWSWKILFARHFPNSRQVERQTHTWFSDASLGGSELFDVPYNKVLDFWNNEFDDSYKHRDIYGSWYNKKRWEKGTYIDRVFSMDSKELTISRVLRNKLISRNNSIFLDTELECHQKDPKIGDVLEPIIESRSHYESYASVKDKPISSLKLPKKPRFIFDHFSFFTQKYSDNIENNESWSRVDCYYFRNKNINSCRAEILKKIRDRLPPKFTKITFAQSRSEVGISKVFQNCFNAERGHFLRRVH